jgi:hypothetical protein
MKIQHAFGCIDSKLLLHIVRNVNVFVLQHVIQASTLGQLGHNIQMRRIYSSTQKLDGNHTERQ